jgi:hypothetical protein
MPLGVVPAEVQVKVLQPLATPAVVKPEAFIVAPGERTEPEVGETATDGEAKALPTEAGTPADPDAAGPAGLIETAKPTRAIAKITAAATPRVAGKRDLPVTRLVPDDEDILSRPVSVTSLA